MIILEPVKLIHVHTDDWEGIYVDGLINTQNHSLNSSDWIDVISWHQLFQEEIERYYVNYEYMEYAGEFPSRFENIPKKHLKQEG
jgi:hypothetical protein